jgi:hypothetical protein
MADAIEIAFENGVVEDAMISDLAAISSRAAMDCGIVSCMISLGLGLLAE